MSIKRRGIDEEMDDDELRFECLELLSMQQPEDSSFAQRISAEELIDEAEKLFKYIKKGEIP